MSSCHGILSVDGETHEGVVLDILYELLIDIHPVVLTPDQYRLMTCSIEEAETEFCIAGVVGNQC